jgi:hypothetical protein
MFNQNLVSKPSLKGVLYRFTEKNENEIRNSLIAYPYPDLSDPTLTPLVLNEKNQTLCIKSITSLDCRRCKDISILSIFFKEDYLLIQGFGQTFSLPVLGLFEKLFFHPLLGFGQTFSFPASVSILINTLIPGPCYRIRSKKSCYRSYVPCIRFLMLEKSNIYTERLESNVTYRSRKVKTLHAPKRLPLH